MNYKEKKIDGFLSHFIKCFWMSENGDIQKEHTILPDGYFDLIIEIEKETIVKIQLTGLWLKPMDVKTEKNIKRLAIRFKPLASEYLFNLDFKSLLNSTMILPANFWHFDRLNTTDFENFVAFLTIHTQKLLENAKEIDTRKVQLFDLAHQKNSFTVKEISETIFWNSREINRYFNKQFGLSLKSYLNIVRCNASYKDIAKNILKPQSEYFDQAHFIKEIRKHTGVSPKELSKNENDRFVQLSTRSLR
jgi:AraC-like DNA-binding protein